MQANRHHRRAEWEFLTETNVSGGQYRPEPKVDDNIVPVQPLLVEDDGNRVGTRVEFSLDQVGVPDAVATDLHNGKENEKSHEDSDNTEYDADTDTISDEGDIDDEANFEQQHAILSDNDDSIFATATLILVAESKLRFAATDSDIKDNVRSLNSFVVFDNSCKINPGNKQHR